MASEDISTNRPLFVKEAAFFLGYTVSYVYRLVHEKRIPYYKPGKSRGARIYFRQEDLESFVYRERSSADYELAKQAEQILNTRTRGKI